MYIYVHAAFLLNFILKNISPKKLIKDGNWYYLKKVMSKNYDANSDLKKIRHFSGWDEFVEFIIATVVNSNVEQLDVLSKEMGFKTVDEKDFF